MLRKIGLTVLTLALLACAGVFYTRSRGTIVPGLSPRPLAEVLEEPLATGDSLAIADFARSRCRLLGGTQQRACYEEILLALVERGQVRLAMTGLSVLDREDRSIAARGHDYAHVVGINAWVPGREVGAVYDSCTELFQSGCYHGVIQAYLDATGTDSGTVASLCDQIPSTRTNHWLRFQCVHGLGHGLVQARALHLPRALSGCDWLGSGWDRESCYGGAFMEFILAGRGQEHHPHSRADSATTSPGAHGDHAEPEAVAAPPSDTFAIRDRTDPLYPCSAIGERYQSSCYGMQAGIIIEITGADFGKIAAACDRAPIALRPACYQGIGTYISGFTVRDAQRSIALCLMGSVEYRPWCFNGVVKNFIDVTSNPDDGFAFCRLVGDHSIAVTCHVAVGEEMSMLRPRAADREQECAKADPRYREACRFGAGLSPARPVELPRFTPGTD
jgi:hypothetical protein